MSKRWTGFAVIPFLVLGLALAGCGGGADTGNAPGATGNTAETGNTAGNTAGTETGNTTGNNAGDQRDVGEMTGDAALTAQVKSAFIADPDVAAMEINVDTVDNVVTLNGTVDTEAQKQKAEQIAKGVEGVKSVVNNLKVGKEDAAEGGSR